MNIVAFEVMVKAQIELKLSVIDHHGRAAIQVEASAYSRPALQAERTLLGSALTSTSATRLKSLEAVVIHALYQLDSTLASNVLPDGENIKA